MKQLRVHSELCVGCRSCEVACIVAHSQSKTLMALVSESEHPQRRIVVKADRETNVPQLCLNCSDMPCVHACRIGSMYRDEATGFVQVDDTCIGCWLCIKACPHGAITKGPQRKIVKCDRCRELDYNPACVSACPTMALQWIEAGQSSAPEGHLKIKEMREVNTHA